MGAQRHEEERNETRGSFVPSRTVFEHVQLLLSILFSLSLYLYLSLSLIDSCIYDRMQSPMQYDAQLFISLVKIKEITK